MWALQTATQHNFDKEKYARSTLQNLAEQLEKSLSILRTTLEENKGGILGNCWKGMSDAKPILPTRCRVHFVNLHSYHGKIAE